MPERADDAVAHASGPGRSTKTTQSRRKYHVYRPINGQVVHNHKMPRRTCFHSLSLPRSKKWFAPVTRMLSSSTWRIHTGLVEESRDAVLTSCNQCFRRSHLLPARAAWRGEQAEAAPVPAQLDSLSRCGAGGTGGEGAWPPAQAQAHTRAKAGSCARLAAHAPACSGNVSHQGVLLRLAWQSTRHVHKK